MPVFYNLKRSFFSIGRFKTSFYPKLLTLSLGTAGLVGFSSLFYNRSSVSNHDTKIPVFTRKQVAEHSTLKEGVWVIYQNSVYDITDFVASHPGGPERILQAAGKSLDPFWK